MQDGLAVGMSVDHARRVCPSLQVLAPNPARVHTADESLLRVVARYAPVWELSQPGSFLMDVTGTRKLLDLPVMWRPRYNRKCLNSIGLTAWRESGVTNSMAQTAATLIAPSELYDVRPGSEEVFMSPLPVGTLPGLHRPCMRKVLHRLDDLNLCTLGDVARVHSMHWNWPSATMPDHSPAGRKGSTLYRCSRPLFSRAGRDGALRAG